jgi:hypothetical protein
LRHGPPTGVGGHDRSQWIGNSQLSGHRAQVAAVTGTANTDLVSSLGADHFVDYMVTDFVAREQTTSEALYGLSGPLVTTEANEDDTSAPELNAYRGVASISIIASLARFDHLIDQVYDGPELQLGVDEGGSVVRGTLGRAFPIG